MTPKVAIGIDFGTSKCCVAAVRNGKVEVLPNATGMKTTPSCVAFDKSRCLVGYDAEFQAVTNPKNSVTGLKKILGRAYDDPIVQKYMKYSPLTMVNVDNQPTIRVDYRGETLDLSPEVITAMLLRKIKEEAERHVGEIGGAVVSVPAYFSNGQRQAIVTASKLAGLELLDLICEPTATALTYSKNKKVSEAHDIVVVDIGAGKLDVAVIRVSDEVIHVLAVCGDDSFGGDDLDLMLMKSVLRAKMPECRHQLTPEQLIRLSAACESTKRALTLSKKKMIYVDSHVFGQNIEHTIHREKIETVLSQKMVSKFRCALDQVLKIAGVHARDVAEVIAVGGTSRVLMIERMIKTYFKSKTLNKTVNADEAVAQGAALLAYRLSHGISQPRVQEVIADLPKIDSLSGPRGATVEINIPQCCFHKLSGVEKFSFGKFGKVPASNLLPRSSEALLEITPSLSMRDFDAAAKRLECFENDIRVYEEKAAALNDLEEFCFAIKEKLQSLMKSADDILSWTSDKEELTAQESAQRKEVLLAASQTLLNLKKEDEEHVLVGGSRNYVFEQSEASPKSDTGPEEVKEAPSSSSKPSLVDGWSQTQACDAVKNISTELVDISETYSVGIQFPDSENSAEDLRGDKKYLNNENHGNGPLQSRGFEHDKSNSHPATCEDRAESEEDRVRPEQEKSQTQTNAARNRLSQLLTRNVVAEAKTFSRILSMPSTRYLTGSFPVALADLLPQLQEMIHHIDEHDLQARQQILRSCNEWFRVLQHYFEFCVPNEYVHAKGEPILKY